MRTSQARGARGRNFSLVAALALSSSAEATAVSRVPASAFGVPACAQAVDLPYLFGQPTIRRGDEWIWRLASSPHVAPLSVGLDEGRVATVALSFPMVSKVKQMAPSDPLLDFAAGQATRAVAYLEGRGLQCRTGDSPIVDADTKRPLTQIRCGVPRSLDWVYAEYWPGGTLDKVVVHWGNCGI